MKSSIHSLAASAAFTAAIKGEAHGRFSRSGGRGTRQHNPPRPPLANLSRFHPDYGLTPQAHAVQKVLREAGKVDFVPKGALRERRLRLLRQYGL